MEKNTSTVSVSLILNYSPCLSHNMQRVKYTVKCSCIKHTLIQQIYAHNKVSFSLNFKCIINLLDITYWIIMNQIIHFFHRFSKTCNIILNYRKCSFNTTSLTYNGEETRRKAGHEIFAGPGTHDGVVGPRDCWTMISCHHQTHFNEFSRVLG